MVREGEKKKGGQVEKENGSGRKRKGRKRKEGGTRRGEERDWVEKGKEVQEETDKVGVDVTDWV